MKEKLKQLRRWITLHYKVLRNPRNIFNGYYSLAFSFYEIQLGVEEEGLLSLKNLVLQEARNLRRYTTKEEKEKLDYDKLSPFERRECIYGQLTGHCESRRAVELLNKCSKPFSMELTRYIIPFGSYIDRGYDIRGLRCSLYSPIEFYITLPKSNNKDLISFIKGEIEEENLKLN